MVLLLHDERLEDGERQQQQAALAQVELVEEQ